MDTVSSLLLMVESKLKDKGNRIDEHQKDYRKTTEIQRAYQNKGVAVLADNTTPETWSAERKLGS
jgi:hypothetical protein